MQVVMIAVTWMSFFVFQNPQSCTKLVGTHAQLIAITSIIMFNVDEIRCLIHCPCFKCAFAPSLPHQAMLVYTCALFIRSALSLATLILGSGERGQNHQMSQQFCKRLQN